MHSPMFVFNSNTLLLVSAITFQVVTTWRADRQRRQLLNASLARTPEEFAELELRDK